MNKQQILDAIQEYIKENGLQEITGTILNTILKSIANIIPDDAMLTSSFGGVVSPGQVITFTTGLGRWFIANAGDYPNYGNFTFVKKNINFLTYDGYEWSAVEVALPESKAFIPAFSTMSFPLSGDVQVTNEGSIWQLNAAQTATETDLPTKESLVWEKLGGADFTTEQFNKEAENLLPNIPTVDYLISDDLSNVDFVIHIPQAATGLIYTYKAEKVVLINKIRIKAFNDGLGNIVCLRNGLIIEIASNVDLVEGWNDISVDFSAQKDDLIGYDTNISTAQIYYLDGVTGSYYYNGNKIPGNISVELHSLKKEGINTFEDLVLADISNLDNSKKVLNQFLIGETKTKLVLSDYKLGYIKNDGTTYTVDSYNKYTEIPVSGFDKIRYIGGQAISSTNDLYASVLVKLKDGTFVKILDCALYTPTLDAIDVVLDLPKTAEKALIGWSNVDKFLNSNLRVELIKKGDVLENSVYDTIEKSKSLMSVGNDTHIFIEKPENFVPIFNLIGELPTDISEARAKTNMVLEMYNGSTLFFKCKVEVKIQGSSSVAAYKKNFSIKFLNDFGGTLKIKIGDWNIDSSFHLKGYGTSDGLLISRDISAANLMSQIIKNRPFPKSLVSDFPRFSSTTDVSTSNFGEDAKMVLGGFPLQLNLNGSYRGLYICRQRRENGVFRMNEDLKNNIYLANSNTDEIIFYDTFRPDQWEMKSPKISGYSEHGVIDNAEVMGHINSFFDWCKGINEGTINFEATANNVINIDNWVDVIIFNQVVQNWDFYVNNHNLLFWGKKWSLGVTDLDWTSGLGVAGFGGVNGLNWRGSFFPNKIYPALLSRIKTRYTELRANGILDLNNLNKIYSQIPSKVGENRYKKEIEYWLEFPQSRTGMYTTEFIMQNFIQRFVYLDSIWKL